MMFYDSFEIDEWFYKILGVIIGFISFEWVSTDWVFLHLPWGIGKIYEAWTAISRMVEFVSTPTLVANAYDRIVELYEVNISSLMIYAGIAFVLAIFLFFIMWLIWNKMNYFDNVLIKLMVGVCWSYVFSLSINCICVSIVFLDVLLYGKSFSAMQLQSEMVRSLGW